LAEVTDPPRIDVGQRRQHVVGPQVIACWRTVPRSSPLRERKIQR